MILARAKVEHDGALAQVPMDSLRCWSWGAVAFDHRPFLSVEAE
jgi:hypothetical protein